MISVIIPSYHASGTIVHCLESLMAQELEEPFEILVVNSSADDTPRLVKQRFPKVTVVQLPARVFAGTARNAGAERSRGELLAFIDADCTAPPDWLARIVSRQREGRQAVGGSIVDATGSLFSRAEYPLELIDFSPRNPEREVAFVSSANSAYTRDVYVRHGGFPDIRAGEDMVFCHGLSRAGVKLLYDPAIRVFHRNDVGCRGFVRKQLMHGRHSFAVRKAADLPGSALNNRLLFPLLLPLVPFLRAGRIAWRSLALRNGLIRDIMITFPVFFLGCLCWTTGYARGFFGDLFGR